MKAEAINYISTQTQLAEIQSAKNCLNESQKELSNQSKFNKKESAQAKNKPLGNPNLQRNLQVKTH